MTNRFVSVCVAFSLLACSVGSSAQQTESASSGAIFIEPQPLATALQAFSEQSGLQVGFESQLAQGLQSQGTHGAKTASEALGALLAGTGLEYRFINEQTVVIREKTAARVTGPMPESPVFRLAQTESAQGSTDSNAASGQLEEVVVTAQKRIERLQDVPVPVTAINAETLVNNHQLRLQDYFSSVPGLSLTSERGGDAQLSIRGLTTGGLTNPTVGIILDDAPYGSISALGSSLVYALDVDPNDLTQIEVLRGPQGTLYGASSLGGLLKYVTIDPSTASFSGRVQADVNSVRNGDGEGYGLRASFNVPLSDTLALRASGFTRQEAGYVDGVFLGDPPLRLQGINSADLYGGRVALLWQPVEDWSVKLSALMQHKESDGLPRVTQGAGEFQQILAVRAPDSYRHDVRSYIATVKGRVRGADLISISGYGIDTHHASNDTTQFLGGAAEEFFGVSGAQTVNARKNNKFTQEIRLSGSAGPRVDWITGLFYTHEDTPTRDTSYAVDPATLEIRGLLFADPYPTTYDERALFGDLTFHVTDRFDVQIGGRGSKNKQSYSEDYSGALLPEPFAIPAVHTRDSSFTYLLTPSFKILPDLMVYGRFASGYRPGGPNPLCSLFGVNCSYEADTTDNYEVGIKAQAFEHRMSLEASVYYIDWKDIQISLSDQDSGQVYFSNVSTAKSQGVELSMQVRPARGLTLAGWVAWNDATLTDTLPVSSNALGVSGDRLPNSARFSGNFSIDAEMPVTDRLTAFVGGSVSYIGDRKSLFPSLSPPLLRLEMPGYAQTNLSAGARYNSWTANLYVNNLTDRRGVLSAADPQTSLINYIQPRTIGVSLAKTF
jgi:outer membrane receptor protein involved in Fe transport